MHGNLLKLTAEEIIERLELVPHPCEGGFFRETYRAPLMMPSDALPSDYTGERCASTAIYFLLTPESFSEMHRLPTDEVFHFYLGDPVEMLQLHSDGRGEIVKLGNNLAAGELPQLVVRGNIWQGARLVPGGEFALLGTTVAPGFEFADFAGGRRAELIAQYPDYAGLITALTRA
jgi:predicted cupin superfamily sugar epimerase